MSNSDQFSEHKLITVLIVDDHPLFRDGLQRALEMEKGIKVIGHCGDGESALRRARETFPDVILLDINLPGMNGLQVARQLRAERIHGAVVMLTAHHDTQQILHAMRVGAMAYCSKDIKPDDLVTTIRDVVTGLYVVESERMDQRTLDQWISSHIQQMAGHYTADADEPFVPLSPRETEILQFVTRGMSNKEIAARLGISQQTVKNHMTSILNKLNVEDRTQAAVTALRNGWVRIK